MVKSIFLSHASEDKEILEKKIIKCLRENGIEYWYDKSEISPGESIVSKINEGLSNTDVAIVLFSRSYLVKDWTQFELDIFVALLVQHKVRIIPLLTDDIDLQQVLDKFIILSAIQMVKIPKCDKLVSTINKNLKMFKKIDGELLVNYVNTGGIDNRDDNEKIMESNPNGLTEFLTTANGILQKIFESLDSLKTDEAKDALLIQIRDYSEKPDVWRLPIWWSILKSLIYSSDSDYLDYGISSLLEMMKRVGEVDKENVKLKSNELFGYRVMEFVENQENKLTAKSFSILNILLDYDDLFLICLGNVIDSIQSIDDQDLYLKNIRMFIDVMEKGNKNQTQIFCNELEKVMGNPNIIREKRQRARYLFDAYHKKSIT